VPAGTRPLRLSRMTTHLTAADGWIPVSFEPTAASPNRHTISASSFHGGVPWDERNPRDKSQSEEFGDRSEHDVADEGGLGLENNESDDEDQNEDEGEGGEEDETITP